MLFEFEVQCYLSPNGLFGLTIDHMPVPMALEVGLCMKPSCPGMSGPNYSNEIGNN